MSMATDVLKANHVGVRELKQTLSSKMLHETLVITDRGKPVSVNLPYDRLLDLIDFLDELSDPKTMELVQKGKAAIKAGAKGIPVSSLFNKMRKAGR